MKSIAGIVLVLGGIAAYLYNWLLNQRARQKRGEEFIVFLQKSIFAIDAEKVKLIDYLENYKSTDEVLESTLREISSRLSQNIYPEGQSVWEEVFREEKQNWDFDEETFGLVIGAGNGFFGRNRSENICFLQKSLKEMELQMERKKAKDAQERKVWIPVGMLGGVMLMIIFI